MVREVGEVAAEVAQAAREGRRLRVVGGGSKRFLGNAVDGEDFWVGKLEDGNGVVSYAPSELVVTAQGGASLKEVAEVLAVRGQMLSFDPPRFGEGGTFGGAVAAGLAGPGKPRFGGVRDAVLGVRVIDGRGRVLSFGGQVMKNVAGFDVSRLFAGSLGTLGVILEASVRVVPVPAGWCSVSAAVGAVESVQVLQGCVMRSLPVAASFWVEGRLFVRFAGGEAAVAAGVGEFSALVGGEVREEVEAEGGEGGFLGDGFWGRVRDLEAPFFARREVDLWRVSVPATAAAVAVFASDFLTGRAAFGWDGAVVWLVGGEAGCVRARAREAGGVACLFRRGEGGGGEGGEYLPRPVDSVLRLHRRVWEAMDPAGVFCSDRMYR